ncbi:MAG: hypothetical protein IJQ56_11515 [Synergistaceae bacterium]|nr:hypothetical protein [Synergistaceae bacterium]MBR0204979.1 hypothetical protein [Synergistaceae bacterium]
MKRLVINIVKILLLLTGFLYALWVFMPYREMGKLAMSIAHSQLEKRGMRLAYSDVTGENDGFTVNNLALNGAVNLSFSSITIRPRILSSILSLGLVSNISFKGLNIQVGQVMNFGDGGFLLTAGLGGILLEQLRTNGDFALNGYLSLDLAKMRIARAEARLNVPEEFEKNLETMKNFLPLVKEGGRWYLRRK